MMILKHKVFDRKVAEGIRALEWRNLRYGRVYDKETRGSIYDLSRRNVLSCPIDNEWLLGIVHDFVFNTIVPAYEIDSQDVQFNSTFNRYVDGGHYELHTDQGRNPIYDVKGNARRRVVSASIGVNSGYEGGDLVIQSGGGDKVFTTSPGLAVVFPSRVVHGVTPVTSGEREVIVAWITVPFNEQLQLDTHW